MELISCARCDSTGMLHTHHMDFDHSNDNPENLLCLCMECHREIHNGKWKLEDIGLITPAILYSPVPMGVLTESQMDALRQIKTLENHFGVRWFIQEELLGITLHSMKSLVQKGFLEERVLKEHYDMPYYRYRGGFESIPAKEEPCASEIARRKK